MTAALDTAADSFKATLRQLGLSGNEPELGDAAQMGRRAALVSAAGTVWQGQLGPVLGVRQAQDLLGVSTRQAGHDPIARHRLLALPNSDDRILVPLFQFTDRGRPYDRVAAVLRVFAEVAACRYQATRQMLTPLRASAARVGQSRTRLDTLTRKRTSV